MSVVAGIAAGRRLWGPRTGFVFGLLYVACPFALFYDRLALTDPPMAAFAALALLLTVRLHEDPRPGLALLLCLALVAAVLTKATALLVVVIPLAGLLLLGPLEARRVRAFLLAILAAAAVLFWPVVRFFATTSTVRLGVGHQDADLAARARYECSPGPFLASHVLDRGPVPRPLNRIGCDVAASGPPPAHRPRPRSA